MHQWQQPYQHLREVLTSQWDRVRVQTSHALAQRNSANAYLVHYFCLLKLPINNTKLDNDNIYILLLMLRCRVVHIKKVWAQVQLKQTKS